MHRDATRGIAGDPLLGGDALVVRVCRGVWGWSKSVHRGMSHGPGEVSRLGTLEYKDGPCACVRLRERARGLRATIVVGAPVRVCVAR